MEARIINYKNEVEAIFESINLAFEVQNLQEVNRLNIRFKKLRKINESLKENKAIFFTGYDYKVVEIAEINKNKNQKLEL